MTPEQMTGLIQALGFPICSALATGWALWKIGNRLLDSHFGLVDRLETSLDSVNTNLEEQTKLLKELPAKNAAELNKACRHPIIDTK